MRRGARVMFDLFFEFDTSDESPKLSIAVSMTI